MIAIRATNLSKKFDIYAKPSHRAFEFLSFGRKKYHTEFWALKELDFSINEGQVIGLLGPNGSGKTTLMKLIAGITHPSQGTIERHGRVSALIELGMGFHPEFSGRANVYLNASLMGIPSREIEEKFNSILNFSGLRDFIDYPIKTYSSGMQVRLAFSIAISVNPDILLIDEALAVGDALFQHRCMKKIKEFHKKGTTIFFASHDMVTLKTLCQKVMLIDKGKLLEMGDTGDVIDQYTELVARSEAKYVKSLSAQSLSYNGETSASGDIKTGRRYGSFKAKILSVKLFTLDGEERPAFVSGDSVRIQVTLLIMELIESLTVGIVIRSPHGLEIFGTNTYHKNIFLEECQEGDEITVSFEQEVRLAPGSYFITAALHAAETHNAVCFDWWNDAVLLKVSPGDSVFSGVTNLDSKVTLYKNSLTPAAFQKVLTENIFSDAPSTVTMKQENSDQFFLSGWYDTEDWKGEIVRWTGREAIALLKCEKYFSRIHIRVFAANENLAQHPLTGGLTVNGDSCGTFELKNKQWTDISLPLSRKMEGVAKIKIIVDRTWKSENFQLANDNRDLGVAVEQIRFS